MRSCGSDLSGSPGKAQANGGPKKKYRLSVWHVVGIIIGATFLYLQDLLPEGVTQWIDWFFGKGKPYSPSQIIRVAFFLSLAVIVWLLGYLRPLIRKRGGPRNINSKTQGPIK